MTINPLITKIFRPNVTANFWQQTSWAILRAVVGIMMIHTKSDLQKVLIPTGHQINSSL